MSHFYDSKIIPQTVSSIKINFCPSEYKLFIIFRCRNRKRISKKKKGETFSVNTKGKTQFNFTGGFEYSAYFTRENKKLFSEQA